MILAHRSLLLLTSGRPAYRPVLGVDLAPVRQAWAALDDGRLAGYKNAIPAAWATALPAVDDAISLIQGVRDHIDDALAEVRRVLT